LQINLCHHLQHRIPVFFLQLIGLAPLICGIIALVDEKILEDIFKAIPGMEEIADVVNLPALISNYAIAFTVIGAVIATIGLIGCIGVCCQVKCFLYLVSTLNTF
jgi:hypothetical protein